MKGKKKAYRFRDGGHAVNLRGLDPTKVQRALEKVQGGDAGLNPRKVWEAARDPKAYLHPAFEWDDSVCGERYRDQQARCLIGVVVEDVPDAPRTWVEAPQGGYLPVSVAMASQDTSEYALEMARKDVSGAQRHLTELLNFAKPPVGRKLRAALVHVGQAEKKLS